MLIARYSFGSCIAIKFSLDFSALFCVDPRLFGKGLFLLQYRWYNVVNDDDPSCKAEKCAFLDHSVYILFTLFTCSIRFRYSDDLSLCCLTLKLCFSHPIVWMCVNLIYKTSLYGRQ